jgi:hypothetical protein
VKTLSIGIVAIVLPVLGCGESFTEDPENEGSSVLSESPFVCPTKPKQLAPIFGDGGLPYYEGRTFACRRFGPGIYLGAKIGWRTGGICTEAPSFTRAIASPDTTSGFSFAPHAIVPPSGKIEFFADVPIDKSLFACVVLNYVEARRRSCIEACDTNGDSDSFWGNTGPDGYPISPVELEPLGISPTVSEAEAWGRDRMRLMIDIISQ